MNKIEKKQVINYLKDDVFSNSSIAIFHYRGLSDKALFEIRETLKEKKCGLKIAKNTLSRLALKEKNLNELVEYFKGPTAIAYSNDIVSLAKILSDYSKKNNNLEIKVGYSDNQLIEVSKIESLAKLGSLDNVRSSFIAKLNAVQSNFVRILAAPSNGDAENFSG